MRTAAAASQAIGCGRPAGCGVALRLEREVLGHELHLARRLLVPLGLERLVGLEGVAAGRALVVVELDDDDRRAGGVDRDHPPRRRCSCSRRAATSAAAPPRPAPAPRTSGASPAAANTGSAAARGKSARSATAAATKTAPRTRAAGRASSALRSRASTAGKGGERESSHEGTDHTHAERRDVDGDAEQTDHVEHEPGGDRQIGGERDAGQREEEHIGADVGRVGHAQHRALTCSRSRPPKNRTPEHGDRDPPSLP